MSHKCMSKTAVKTSKDTHKSAAEFEARRDDRSAPRPGCRFFPARFALCGAASVITPFSFSERGRDGGRV